MEVNLLSWKYLHLTISREVGSFCVCLVKIICEIANEKSTNLSSPHLIGEGQYH